MHKLAAVLPFALALAPAAALAQSAGAGTGQAGEIELAPAEPGAAAMAFAGRFAEDHLSGMLSRIGAGSEALRALAEFDGPAVATVFNARIDAAVRRHGDEWQRNLALAWSPLLTEAEMQSLAAEGAESPHASKYVENREAAAAAMAALSGELFAGILREVLADTVETLVPDAPAAPAE